MFIVSAKLNPKKAITCVILFGLVLIALILIVAQAKRQDSPADSAITAPTDSERTAYLASLGWTVDPSPTETLAFTLPNPLNASYEEYNQLQQEQGFDLAPYAGMQVKRYSYNVTNYPGRPQQVQADLYLCGDTIIGGSILYWGEGAFVDTLVYPG